MVQHFFGPDGYRMDVYAEGLFADAVEVLADEDVPSPIESITFASPSDSAILLPYLVITGGGDSMEYELAPPDTLIPESFDWTDDDDVLRRFREVHALDDEEQEDLRWGDAYSLPGCVLHYEHLLVAERLVQHLRAQGHAVAANITLGTEDAPMFNPRDALEAMCRDNVADLLPQQRADLAAMLYESPAKQRWLLGAAE